MTDNRLLERIARRLTGVTVAVRFKTPTRRGADGQIVRSSSGVYFLDIKPGLTLEQERFVFLHELGHLKSGHIQTPNDGDAFGRSESAPMTRDKQLTRSQRVALEKRESEADDHARRWQAWIDAHGGKLESLLSWFPDDFQRAIDIGVARAFDKLGLKKRGV